ncbi:MAG: SMP-30/gluconolactonase/LRE family protein [Bryobacteraceae bacterium]
MIRTALLLFAAALAAFGAHTVTIAGTGQPGYTGDGGPGAQAQINNPYGLVVGPDGALYFCDIDNHAVRRLDLKTKNITTVAGSGKKGYSGDGGPATKAELNQPYEVRFDKAGNMYFVEMPNHVVRRVDKKTRIITTLAGTGQPGFGGDGGPAAKAQMRQPHSIAFDPQGRMMICDIGNHRVRRIDMKTGVIETWLGTGDKGKTADGAPLAGTPVFGPRAIDLDPQGNMYLALREGNAVYKVDLKAGKFIHLAGTGDKGYTDGSGDARKAELSGPKGIAWSPDGGVYIADTESHTIRRIDLKSNAIKTIIGTGKRGNGPDGDPLKCETARPHGVFVDKKGVLYVGDSEAHRIRMLVK